MTFNRIQTKELEAVMEYLYCNNFLDALEVLEEESGKKFEKTAGQAEKPRVSKALDLFFSHEMQSEAALGYTVEQIEARKLIPSGKSFVSEVSSVIELMGSSAANPTSVCFVPDTSVFLVGLVNKQVLVYEGEQLLSSFDEAPSPVLFLSSRGSDNILMGCMGGESIGLELKKSSLFLMWKKKDHGNQRIIGGSFSLHASYFLTFARDKTICVYSSATEELVGRVNELRAIVEACWISDTVFVVSTEQSSELVYYNMEEGTKGDGCVLPMWKVSSLNYIPEDPHIYFNCLAMASHKGFIAVAADNQNIYLYRSEKGSPIHCLTGLSINQYDSPTIKFSPCGGYLYASNAPHGKGELLVFECMSGSAVHTALCHDKKPIRHFDVSMLDGAVATVSFQKNCTFLRAVEGRRERNKE